MHEKINDYSPTEIRVLFAYNKGVLKLRFSECQVRA